MSKPMISVAGIRGIVADSLRVEEFFRYALAFATLVRGGRVIIGRDSRTSGDMLHRMAVAALQSAGCQIIDLGLVPTPTVGIMILQLQAAGGIAITASHNPAEWNAYKFFGNHGSFLNDQQKDELLAIESSGQFLRADHSNLGQVAQNTDAIGIHVDRILQTVDVQKIRDARFKVVVDCVNGVGHSAAAPLLDYLGCQTEYLYAEPTGQFPRNPEPLPENLVELGQRVKATGAAIGFAIDPDADRLALVDENGTPLGEERTLVLAARSVLAKAATTGTAQPPAVVCNLSTTRALDDVVNEFGARLHRTPIGEAWVVKAITDEHALIGGEGNGGVIFPCVHPGRDAATGIALILQAMAVTGKSISRLNAEVPDYVMIKTKFPATPQAIANLARLVGEEFADADEIITRDGVKAAWADRWVHVRPSGTEPVVRIFAEGLTRDVVQNLVSRAEKLF